MRVALLLSFLVVSPVFGAASGNLTINGKSVKLTHAYAARKADPFAKTKKWRHALTGVGSFSGVGAQKLDVTAMDAKHVAGRIYLEKPDEFFKNTYIYDVKFDAPFSAAPKEADAASLKGTQLPAGGGDPGKAYMAYTKVLAAGDLKGLRKALAADRVKTLDDPDFKEMFPMIQAMQAKNIKVTGGAVDGDTATLLATGKDGDATTNGTITMVRESGAWKVAKESWKTKS